MKVQRAREGRSLKVFCLLLFCALASAMFISRFKANAGVEASARTLASIESPVAENHSPEMDAIRIKRVGVGQRITFGLSVIDEETDDIRVEMTQKPASAKYNEKTLTVDWTPRKTDGHVGQFAVRITEFLRGGASPRTSIKTFSIAIEPKPVLTPDAAPPAPLAVETLISITDPERLAAANARWPILAMFDRIAAIEASKQIKPDSAIQPTTGALLFRDALRNLALLHRNDEINPDSPKYNPQFNAENWRLVMVRPRVNKRIFELRLVYKNVVAGEPVFLMPRMRITRLKDPELDKDEDARQKNNKTFATMFHDAFFDGPDLKPFIARDKKSYGAVLADFISAVVNYSDKDDPNMQANFAALPHNARLGGDDQLDEKGRYLRGDGWALGVMKVVVVERDGKKVLAFSNMPIDGFATSVKLTPDGTAFRRVPAPAFDPKSPLFVAGFDKLVDVGNFSAIPDDHDATMAKPAMIDSSMFSREFKQKQMVAETSLRDPRRRLFEERGMTCIQCHVRNFDEGDYLNAGVKNPKEGTPGSTRDIPRLFFVITPNDGFRSEFFRRNEEEQVGNLKGVMRDYLNIKVNLESPLAAEWPFKTRNGRS
jgi:hypothetical protein